MTYKTKMHAEVAEFYSIVESHIREQNALTCIVTLLKNNKFEFVCTLARGSSDHAAFFAKYLIETYLHKLVSSFAPSVCTLYKSLINFNSTLLISFSQSGQSDDLVQSLLSVKKAGGVTLSFINDVKSPLATKSQYLIPLHAGEEKSVAATKSFLATLSRLVQFVSLFAENISLQQAYLQLPKYLSELNSGKIWNPFLPKFKNINSMYTLGRGYGFPIALEAALKLKETCGIHAEALSGAEVLHGPFELVQENFCCFVFLQQDETLPSMLHLLMRLESMNALVYVVGTSDILASLHATKFNLLPTSKISLHPVLDLILSTVCFYNFVGELALLKGRNPDEPKNLKKVTSTV